MEGESTPVSILKNRKRWLHIFVYSFFVLSCQATATILGRLYYTNGGKSKWMGSLVTIIGFPVLVLFRFCSTLTQQPQTTTTTNTSFRNMSTFKTIGPVYIGIGLLISAICYLSSFGLLYLPVSTYSLIWASQLIFTAFFSYILNSQKFTPFIVNSLFLLIISSTLLVFNNESQATHVSEAKYAIGFLCTVAASAMSGLLLSLVQLILLKVLKKNTFSTVTDMVFYQSLVATCALLVGLFASGEWKTLTDEMKRYKLGEVSYVMTLVITAITWQVYTICLVGLIFESSSVFSNAINAVGLPIVPILAVVVFHDKMDGTKVISIILAIWGFISFAYQHYLDDKNLKNLEGVPDLLLPVSSPDKEDKDTKQRAANSIEIEMIQKTS